MKKLITLELIKAQKLSTLLILIFTIQQSIGTPILEINGMRDTEHLFLYIYNEIFLGKLLFIGYIGIAALAAHSISTELQEKSFQSQIANGLSRNSYFLGKLIFFHLIGTLLLLVMFFIHLVFIRYASGIDFEWTSFIKSSDILMAILCILPFISLGLLIGMFAKPLPAIGVLLLLLIVEWSIQFFDTFFWEVGLHSFFPIRALSSFSFDPVSLVVKVGYALIFICITRYLIINKDFA